MNIYDWMEAASAEERERLAIEAKTSVAYLHQLKGGHRKPSRSLAERLETASNKITPERVICRFEAVFGGSRVTAA